MKQYTMLLVYNDESKLEEWVKSKISCCKQSWYDPKNKHLTLDYDNDFHNYTLFNKLPSRHIWIIGKYFPPNINSNDRFYYRYAGCEFYYVHYLDGLVDASDIRFLMTRTRLGVEDINE